MKYCVICPNEIPKKSLLRNIFTKTCSPECNKELNRVRALERYHKNKVLKNPIKKVAPKKKKYDKFTTANWQAWLQGK